MSREWRVLRTSLAGRKLCDLAEAATALGFHPNVYCPVAPVEHFVGRKADRRRSLRKWVTALEPVFQPYVFVEFGEYEPWESILRLDGAVEFLEYRDGMAAPRSVRRSVMDELRSRIADPSFVSRPDKLLKRHQLVRMLFGPFAEQTATVTAVLGSRVEVDLELFGRKYPMPVHRDDLVAA